MSEENKTLELKDEELEQVNGGAQIEGGSKTFVAGEWYVCNVNHISRLFNVKTTTTCSSTEDTVPCVEWGNEQYGMLTEFPINENATPTAGLLLSGYIQANTGDLYNKNCVK